MDRKSVGALIRRKRKEKQMTQGELAQRLCVSVNAVSKWELGRNAVNRQCLEMIAEVLDIPLPLLQENEEDVSQAEAPLPDAAGSIPPGSEETDSVLKGGKRRFLFLGAGVILLAAVVTAFFIWQGNQYSFTIQMEYFDTYDGQEACYLIAEYEGELTFEAVDEHDNAIRKNYAEYFSEVEVIVILYCESYVKEKAVSLDTADAVSVLFPSPYQ